MRRANPRINKNFKNKYGIVYFLQFFFGNFKRKFFMGFKDFLNNFWGEKWVFFNVKKFLNAFKQTKNVQSSETLVLFTQNIAYGVASTNFLKTKIKNFFSYFIQNKFTHEISLMEAVQNFNNLVSNVYNRFVKKPELMQTILLQKIFNLT